MIQNTRKLNYIITITLLLSSLLIKCKSPDIYLKNSCIECKERSTKLYTVNSNDTFYYSPKYTGRFYHDGLLVLERKGQVRVVKEIHLGMKNGIYRVYYESGMIKVEGNYINGLKSGPFVFYADSNIVYLDSIQYYRKGSLYKKLILEDCNVQ